MKEGLLQRPAPGRSRAYRDLAALFRYPGEDLMLLAREGAIPRDFLAWSEEAGRGPDAGAASLARELCRRLGDLPLQALQSEFADTFGHAVSRDCPPYETHFASAHVYQQAERLADISGFYRAFGLEAAEESRERLDHIALELEFMHFLSFKEAYARERHGEQRAALCREAQRSFMENHLGRWGPSFFRLLARKAEGTLYERAAELGLAFLQGEAEFLEVRPQEEEPEISAPLDMEESGFPCPGAELCGGLEGTLG